MVRRSDRGEGTSAIGEEDADEALLQSALLQYREAVRFKRRSTRALRELDLTFTRWRVLKATCRLAPEYGDVCNHAQVARAEEIYESCVLKAMRELSKQGLVSHDVGEWHLGFRVILTEKGVERLALADWAVRRALAASAKRALFNPGAAA